MPLRKRVGGNESSKELKSNNCENTAPSGFYETLAWLFGTGKLAGAAQGSLDIYTDGLDNGFQDWSYATHSLTNTSPVHSGKYSISVNTVYWNAISFHQTNFDSTPYKSFTFWVNGGVGGQSLGMYAYLNDVYQQYYQIPGVLPPNAWEQIVVPLSALGAANQTNVSRFDIKLAQVGNSTSNEFYVDDVQLVARGVMVDVSQTLRTGRTPAGLALMRRSGNMVSTRRTPCHC